MMFTVTIIADACEQGDAFGWPDAAVALGMLVLMGFIFYLAFRAAAGR